MWFIRVTATPQGEIRPIQLITEMACLSLNDGEQQYVYPTQFFAYFQGCPTETAFGQLPVLEQTTDEQWDSELERVLGKERLNDLLKEKETKERITTA